MFDWASAYRQILVRQADLPILGFRHRGKFYAGIHAPYAQQHCWIINTFVDGLEACHFAENFFLVCCVLRDADAARRKQPAHEVTKDLKIEVPADKGVQRDLQLIFLGVAMYNHRLQLSIPKDNVDAALELFRDFLQSKSVTFTELQKVLSQRNWMCAVLPAGRTFIGLLALLRNQNAMCKKHRRTKARLRFRIGWSARKDIKWRILALENTPAQAYFEKSLPEKAIDCHVECDATEHLQK